MKNLVNGDIVRIGSIVVTVIGHDSQNGNIVVRQNFPANSEEGTGVDSHIYFDVDESQCILIA